MRLREGTRISFKVRLLAKNREFDRKLASISIRLILCMHRAMAKALIEGCLMTYVGNVHKDAAFLDYGMDSLIS